MPGPVGRPTVRVRPDVSECSRMPVSRRPVSSAATACPPSWTIVTTLRDQRHTASRATAKNAPTPVPPPSPGAGSNRSIVIAPHTVTVPRWHAGRPRPDDPHYSDVGPPNTGARFSGCDARPSPRPPRPGGPPPPARGPAEPRRPLLGVRRQALPDVRPAEPVELVGQRGVEQCRLGPVPVVERVLGPAEGRLGPPAQLDRHLQRPLAD